MTISAWFTVALAIPVLLLGEVLVKRIGVLSRFNIPAPVVGGLLLSLLVLLGNVTGLFAAKFQTSVAAQWWTWIVTTELEWVNAPSKSVNLPFLVAFFTCIGLNASWMLVKRGSLQVLLFLALAGVLAVVQNGLGVALAKLMGVSPLLGLMCGSVSMTGGHGTALGFAGDLERAGLQGASVIGVAAATFGLVAGGLLGGPVGGALIRRRNLKPVSTADTRLESGQTAEPGILPDLGALAGFGRQFLLHLALLLVCVKVGAWVSYLIQQTNITFPVYMGAMILGVAVRNVVDLSGGRWIKTEIIDRLASVTLGIFLAIAMMSLNLIELANTAVPMLVILAVQVTVIGFFAWFVTFRLMGRDFDAAVMAGGHCGFGLGATPNAVANMKALVERYGPAPRAFLVVPIVGAFLIDFVNAMNITFFLNLVKP
ncbi:MAG: sodium/glutamate symporter [Verrucomicrobia bacterium]|nr:sodium/glutamate symporter [Verrucomicrobiota bacterium]